LNWEDYYVPHFYQHQHPQTSSCQTAPYDIEDCQITCTLSVIKSSNFYSISNLNRDLAKCTSAGKRPSSSIYTLSTKLLLKFIKITVIIKNQIDGLIMAAWTLIFWAIKPMSKGIMVAPKPPQPISKAYTVPEFSR
jgi:hypothetical protein